MLQSLPIALAQAQASNTSQSLFSEIHQIMYLLYPAKNITEKVYNNVIIQ